MPLRVVDALTRRFFPGFRATALVLFALVWFSVGAGIITRPNVVDAEHRLPLEYLPLWLRVAIWWVAAACAIIATFWPPGDDRWGWVLLSLPVSLRAVTYFAATCFGWLDVTHFVSWAVILTLVVLISFWPEPVRGRIVTPDVRP